MYLFKVLFNSNNFKWYGLNEVTEPIPPLPFNY